MADDAPPDQPPEPGPAPAPTPSTPDKADKSTGKSPDDPGDHDQAGTERDPVGEDRSENEAYRRGRESFRSTGNTASASRSKFKNIIGGDYYSYKNVADSGDKKTSVLFKAKELDRIRATFALVADYEPMLDAVGETRVILLRGCAGTGMTTTAVRLLDEVADGNVAEDTRPPSCGPDIVVPGEPR